MTSLTPLHANVIVRRDESPTTSGRLHLPENTIGNMITGTVLAVGPYAEEYVSAGDCVMWEPYTGAEVEHDGEKVLILDVGELIAIVEGDDR